MKLVGPVDVRSLNTPSRAVTLYRPFLSDRDLETEIIERNGDGDGAYIMTWSVSMTSSSPFYFWHSFHPLLNRYPRWTRNCVTRLTLI